MSNFVDQVRFSVSPARAGTTAPRPKRALQASMAAISGALRLRSSWPISDSVSFVASGKVTVVETERIAPARYEPMKVLGTGDQR